MFAKNDGNYDAKEYSIITISSKILNHFCVFFL